MVDRVVARRRQVDATLVARAVVVRERVVARIPHGDAVLLVVRAGVVSEYVVARKPRHVDAAVIVVRAGVISECVVSRTRQADAAIVV